MALLIVLGAVGLMLLAVWGGRDRPCPGRRRQPEACLSPLDFLGHPPGASARERAAPDRFTGGRVDNRVRYSCATITGSAPSGAGGSRRGDGGGRGHHVRGTRSGHDA